MLILLTIIDLINKFMRKFFIIFFFLISVGVNPSFSSITKYFGSSKLSLDETGVINFMRYLEGIHHAEDIFFDRAAQHNMSPIYYAVSEDGKFGYGWFCRSYIINDCSEEFTAYRLIETCKEYTKKNCYIFASRNEIVWNNLNVYVEKLTFEKNRELLKKLNLYNSNSSKKINDMNYLSYINLAKDNCVSESKLENNLKLIRGANIDCLLPGRSELSNGDKLGAPGN